MASSAPPPTTTAVPTAPGPPVFSTDGASEKRTNGSTPSSKPTSTADKPQTTADALLPPIPTSTLHSAPVSRRIRSFLLLFLILLSFGVAAKYMDLDIFQTPTHQGIVISGVLFGLWYMDAIMVDFWELLVGYWWVTLPLVGGAGVILVLMQEGAEVIVEVD